MSWCAIASDNKMRDDGEYRKEWKKPCDIIIFGLRDYTDQDDKKCPVKAF